MNFAYLASLFSANWRSTIRFLAASNQDVKKRAPCLHLYWLIIKSSLAFLSLISETHESRAFFSN